MSLWSVFRPFARWIDNGSGADEALIRELGPEYEATVGVLGWVTLVLIVAGVSAGALTWVGTRTPTPTYAWLAPDSTQPKPFPVLGNALVLPSRVQNWTTQAIGATMTYTFLDVEQRQAAASRYYTADAWASMRRALEANKLIATVQANRLAVTVTPLKPPRIVNLYTVNGVQMWDLEAPVLLSYTGAAEVKNKEVLIDIKIKQVPGDQSPDGLAIISFSPRSDKLL